MDVKNSVQNACLMGYMSGALKILIMVIIMNVGLATYGMRKPVLVKIYDRQNRKRNRWMLQRLSRMHNTRILLQEVYLEPRS